MSAPKTSLDADFDVVEWKNSYLKWILQQLCEMQTYALDYLFFMAFN